MVGSDGTEPKAVLGSTSEAALQNSISVTYWNSNFMKNVVVFLFTYRLELLCDAVKTLRLARPAATAASALFGRACSTCVVGGSPAV